MKFYRYAGRKQKPVVQEYGRAEHWDYFLRPDRFFSRLFKRESQIPVPFLILLLSFVLPIIFWWILAGYIDTFVPYNNVPISRGLLVAGSVLRTWITGIFFFLLFSGRLFRTSQNSRSRVEWAARAFTAMSFAIIPVIVIGILWAASFLVVLPGIQINHPTTDAHEAYLHIEAEYWNSVDQYFLNEEHNSTLALPSAQQMVRSRDSADREGDEGVKQVVSQLQQDPFIHTLGSLYPVISVIVMLWVAILLIFGIRHALDISLASSVVMVGFLVYLNFLFLEFSH